MKQNKSPQIQDVWTVLKLHDRNSGKTRNNFLTLEVKEHICLKTDSSFYKEHLSFLRKHLNEVA